MAAPPDPPPRFVHDNGLSLTLFGLASVSIVLQSVTGYRACNAGLAAAHLPAIGAAAYLGTGNFLDGVLSNWQAALLQLAVLIALGPVLRQKGATHSRAIGDPGEPEAVGYSWAYRHSLGLAFVAMFVVTFALHLVFATWKYNEDQALQHLPPMTVAAYATTSSFWYTVFQCWEAEFAVLGLYVVASISLREEGSPESKPVAASDEQTGGADDT